MKTTRIEHTLINGESRDFGVTDKKGRAIGARVQIFRDVHVELPEDSKSWCVAPAGTSYWVAVRALRNGEAYGPAFNGKCLPDLVSVSSYVGKYFHQAKTRAIKAVRS